MCSNYREITLLSLPGRDKEEYRSLAVSWTLDSGGTTCFFGLDQLYTLVIVWSIGVCPTSPHLLCEP